MIFQPLKISRLLLAIALSTFLIACDGESSSNSSSDDNDTDSTEVTDSSNDNNTDSTEVVESNSSSNQISEGENGNRILTTNDTVVEVDPSGNATVLEDPSGNATVTDNPNGGDTVNLDRGRIITTPDGSITQIGGEIVE